MNVNEGSVTLSIFETVAKQLLLLTTTPQPAKGQQVWQRLFLQRDHDITSAIPMVLTHPFVRLCFYTY